MVSGALLLFALVLGYVYRFGYGYNGLTGEQAALFMLLAVGAVALGGIAEGRSWGVKTWLLVALAAPLLLLLALGWHQPYWWLMTCGIAVHGWRRRRWLGTPEGSCAWLTRCRHSLSLRMGSRRFIVN
ncbi:Uncharacterised protein [Serratia fonticola]|uniref:Uncharacterized protein n=1 Tax=Serratia fonticola TaxID=47917 RepID=A0A4V6KMM9_SERFO|nr:Uncharacterised protein [Serratia fonticola]